VIVYKLSNGGDLSEEDKRLIAAGCSVADLMHLARGIRIEEDPEEDAAKRIVDSDKSILLQIASKLVYSKGVLTEGMVIKTDYGKDHPRHSFKVISNEFLLKHGL